jgi:hypothetical protein
MREQILNEIQRLAEANGGQPPGRRLLERKTGINEGAWFGKYWARWGDAVAEAGFAPNSKNEKLDEQFVLEKLAEITRHYGKVPASMEMRLFKRTHPDFPNEKTILGHFGGKQKLVARLAEWSRAHSQFADVANLLADIEAQPDISTTTNSAEGLVYLIKSGAHYKIGRSDELERRMKEIKVALPEAFILVHTIRTDDPPGIEAYWHRRFADRRANGEWFKLSNSDIAAFKRRKFQ